MGCFSPLAGIKFAESETEERFRHEGVGFSPLAGIKFAERGTPPPSVRDFLKFQSPCGD